MGLRCCRVKIEYNDSRLEFYKNENKIYILGYCNVCFNPILKHIEFNEDYEVISVVRYNKITSKTKDLIELLKTYEAITI